MLVGIVALVAAIQASTSVAKLTLAMATVKAVGRSRTRVDIIAMIVGRRWENGVCWRKEEGC
jgi:hypothetical protein